MLKLLLTRFWPVLLPVILYLAWLAMARRKAHKNGDTPLTFTEGPWLWPVVASILLLIGGFVWLGVSSTAEVPLDGQYVPARVVDGKIIPPRVEPR